MAALSTSFRQVFSENPIYRFVCSFKPTLYSFCYNLSSVAPIFTVILHTHIPLPTSESTNIALKQTIHFLICRNNRFASSLMSVGQVNWFSNVFTKCQICSELIYLVTYLLTYSLTHSPTHLLTYLLTYSLTYLLTYLIIYLLTYSLTHSLTHLPYILYLLYLLHLLHLLHLLNYLLLGAKSFLRS